MLKKLILVLILLWPSIQALCQTSVDSKINENRGRLIVRQIEKRAEVDNGKARLVIRIYSPFCQQRKATNQAGTQLFVDSNGYTLNKENIIDLTIDKGFHTLAIPPHSDNFSPFKPTKYRFKNKRKYVLDFYLPVGFSSQYH